MQNISNEVRARVLNDALPYIQKYNNKIVVVKYGGNAMTNETLKQAVMSDIVLLTLVGVKVVLVHGGGPEINDMLGKLGIESRFIGGLRYTDEATIDVVKMVFTRMIMYVASRIIAMIHAAINRNFLCAILTTAITSEKTVSSAHITIMTAFVRL